MKNSSRGFSVIVLFLIILGLILAGVVIYPKIKVLKVNSGAAKTRAVPDNWLTYENQTYYYEIKYPPEFHAQGQGEPPYPPPPAGMSFTFKYDNGEWCDFTIKSLTSDFFGEMDSLRSDGKNVEHQIKLNTLTGSYFDAQGGEAFNRSYYFFNKGIYYTFGYNYKIGAKYSQNCADTAEKMTSSFKVTN